MKKNFTLLTAAILGFAMGATFADGAAGATGQQQTLSPIIVATSKQEVKRMERKEKRREKREKKREKREKIREKRERLKIKEKKLDAR